MLGKHLEEEQIGELCEVTGVMYPVILEDVIEVSEFDDDIEGLGHFKSG
ncbi:MAG: hypothetical protein ACI9FZ_000679 [Bacteroidia bacterium]